MSNVFSSAIFCARNTTKIEDGDIGRVPVVIGQARNVFDVVKDVDNSIGKTAKTAVNAFNAASKNEALFKYAGKAVHLVGENINPLICLSAGVKVATADDKTSAAIQQTSALSTMFAVEKWMKTNNVKNPNPKHTQKIAEKLTKIAVKFLKIKNPQKCEAKLPEIIQGITYVIGSCLAYSAGEKVGNNIAQAVKGSESSSSIDKKA